MHHEHVLLLIVIITATAVTGCIGHTPIANNNVTPIIVPQAVGLHQEGLNAYIGGNYTAALDLYDRAITADPSYVTAWMDKGNVLMQLNRSQDAVEAYDHALALDQELAVVWNRRGEALMRVGNNSAALDSFDTALSIEPDFVQAKSNRDLVLKKMN